MATLGNGVTDVRLAAHSQRASGQNPWLELLLRRWHTGCPPHPSGSYVQPGDRDLAAPLWLWLASLYHGPAACTSLWECRPHGPRASKCQPDIGCLSVLIMGRGRADLKQTVNPVMAGKMGTWSHRGMIKRPNSLRSPSRGTGLQSPSP